MSTFFNSKSTQKPEEPEFLVELEQKITDEATCDSHLASLG